MIKKCDSCVIWFTISIILDIVQCDLGCDLAILHTFGNNHVCIICLGKQLK